MERFSFQRVIILFSLLCAAFLEPVFGGDSKRVVLRDKSTPCGVYLSSLANDAEGVKVADLSEESIDAYFASKPDLHTRLAYVNKMTGAIVHDPDAIRRGLHDKTLEPVFDRPELIIVGAPLFDVPFVDRTKSKLLRLTRERAKELMGHPIRVRAFGRPGGPLKSVQRVVYFFPLPQDYQRPTRQEKMNTIYKLVVSNGSQQMIVFATNPMQVALTAGAMNVLNSTVTGVYTQSMTNWFNRSGGGTSRFLRGVAVSAFFTTDIYWASRRTLEDFLKILTVSGWVEFAASKVWTVGLNVFWRFYYEQTINRWQREQEKLGHAAEARRVANNLKFLGTILTTPAFLYAASHGGSEILGVSTPFNAGHFGMFLAGAASLPFYYGWLSRDQGVQRLNQVYSAMMKDLERTGLLDVLRVAEAKFSSWQQARATARAADEPGLMDEELKQMLNEALRRSPELQAAVAKEPQLLDLLSSDKELQKLFHKHPQMFRVE